METRQNQKPYEKKALWDMKSSKSQKKNVGVYVYWIAPDHNRKPLGCLRWERNTFAYANFKIEAMEEEGRTFLFFIICLFSLVELSIVVIWPWNL